VSQAQPKLPLLPAVVAFALVALSAIPSDDPVLTLACAFVIAMTILLLWRFGEPPSLLFAASLQIVQVVTPLFYANALGVPLQDVSEHAGKNLTSAAWLALAAMTSLVLGMWLGQLRGRHMRAQELAFEVAEWTPEEAFRFCIVTLLLGSGLETLAWTFEGSRQIFLALSGIQWVGVFVLTCVCFGQRRGFKYLFIVTAFEAAIGFTGFFSGFKTVFFVVVVAILASRTKVKAPEILGGAALAAVVLVLGSFWSAVKIEYRAFVNQGSKQQVVLASPKERFDFFSGKVASMDWQTMGRGFDKLVRRVGYLDFLAATMRNVPERLQFQKGAQIGATVMHVLQPRLLFPDKPALPSDTKITAKYTGLPELRYAKSGTSISIGYVGELYVDFGYAGAIIGPFILGLTSGYAFRFLCSSGSLPAIVNYGLSFMLLLSIAQFEQALSKTVGAFLATLVAVLLAKKYILPRLLEVFGPGDRPGRTGSTPREPDMEGTERWPGQWSPG
jgi:hypothetical protein